MLHRPDRPGNTPGAPPNRTEQLVQSFTRKMRETYVLLGKTLIPLMDDQPGDIDMLIELGGVYEQLGCMREAVIAYERLRQLNPGRLPKSAREFLDQHHEFMDAKMKDATDTQPEFKQGERT